MAQKTSDYVTALVIDINNKGSYIIGRFLGPPCSKEQSDLKTIKNCGGQAWIISSHLMYRAAVGNELKYSISFILTVENKDFS